MADSELRRRPVAPTSSTEAPALTRIPTPPSLTPAATQSGESTPYFISDDDVFSAGFGLVDLLVLLDAHLELWSRGLRKNAISWREKADRIVEESRVRAQKIQRNVKLPRVHSEALLNVLDDTPISLSAKDKENLERKYRELRQKTRDSIKLVQLKWEEEKTVRLRDKISFFFGVMNVLVSALLIGFYPTWIPLFYSAQMAVYFPFRVYDYRKRFYHYFLFDLCYAINAMCLVYLWIFPGNTLLFQACWGLSLGSLGTAIATWRNSLVFHSLDKVISLAIHILPCYVFVTIRHFYPGANVRYPALNSLPHLRPWHSMLICMVAYGVWQVAYFRYVIVARKEKIKQGRATSFTFLINDKKRLIGKIAAKVPEQYRETAFMAGQAVYTFVTLLVPIFALYDSKFWSSAYLISLFAISVWNGACFYLDVFGRKFEKQLLALRKEFEDQQMALKSSSAPMTPPATETTTQAFPPQPTSTPPTSTSDTMSRSTSLDNVSEGGDGESASEESGGSLDGVIEVEPEHGAEHHVAELFGKEGLGEIAVPAGALPAVVVAAAQDE